MPVDPEKGAVFRVQRTSGQRPEGVNSDSLMNEYTSTWKSEHPKNTALL